jgi:hypothetical protein
MHPLHHGSLASRAPVVPLPPLSRGRMARAISFSRRTRARVLQTKATKLLPPKNKGRRSAEKAQLSREATPRIGCCHPYALRARPRVQRDALAFRRSTAALAEAFTPDLRLQARFPGTRSARALPALSCPSPVAAPHAPVVMPADMMPGAARERTVSFRPRGPLSLRNQEHPHDGVPYLSEMPQI